MDAPVTAFSDRAAAMAAAAEKLASAIEQGIGRRGAAAIALSGGTTPEPAYRLLAARKLDWARVTIGLVDERWVAPNDAASNEGLVRRALAAALEQGARLAPMWSDAPDAEAGAVAAEAIYSQLEFDAALMGMGADAHTASWFPGATQLAAALDPSNPRTVMALSAAQAAGASARLSLTRAALRRVGRAILLITGEDKRAVLARAQGLPPAQAPVAALISDLAGRLDILWAP